MLRRGRRTKLKAAFWHPCVHMSEISVRIGRIDTPDTDRYQEDRVNTDARERRSDLCDSPALYLDILIPRRIPSAA